MNAGTVLNLHQLKPAFSKFQVHYTRTHKKLKLIRGSKEVIIIKILFNPSALTPGSFNLNESMLLSELNINYKQLLLKTTRVEPS